MKIAMVSVHISPVAANIPAHESLRIHVAELALELGRQGHRVTVYTRRDGLRSSEQVRLAPRVKVEFITAGDPLPMSEEEVLPHIGEFADRLARRLTSTRPDVVHAHHWLSGLAALSATGGLDVPVVQSFHDLASLGARTGGNTAPARLRMERAIGRGADALIATTESECSELARLGVTRPRIAAVPSGVVTPSTITLSAFGRTRMISPSLPRSLPARTRTAITLFQFHSHHRTSGASETIRMNFLSRSSRPTGPKMRVPRGCC